MLPLPGGLLASGCVCTRRVVFGTVSWVAYGAPCWDHLRVCGVKELLGSGAYCRRILGAGHGPPPRR